MVSLKEVKAIMANMKEAKELAKDTERLEEVGKQSLSTVDLLIASQELQETGLIQDLMFKALSEWDLAEYHKEFVIKGLTAVLKIEPTKGLLQLAELLQEKIDDENLSHVKDYFEDIKQAILNLHNNETFQDYARKYIAVYMSNDPIAREFVVLHQAIQQKTEVVAKLMFAA